MLKQFLTGMFAASISFTAYADGDVTNQFVDYVQNYFVGHGTSADRTWDNTFCVVPNPIGGGCIEKGGSKIYASAHGTVGQIESRFGRGWFITTEKNPWTGVGIPSHWTDLKLTFVYSGVSDGRKQCYPGNFDCGKEWGGLHPQGKIQASFLADGQKLFIAMTYEAIQNHGDKPNAVLRQAMENLAPKLQQIVTDFVRLQGSQAIVELK
jgi:hypothetical protein